MARRFNDKVAIVTGAAHGIGRACAQRLSDEKATVVLADVDHDTATRVAAQLHTDAVAVECDVTSSDSVTAMVEATVTRYGRVDVLINNVGGTGSETADVDEWQRQLGTSLLGAMRCIDACAPYLLDSRGGGAVVSISSVNGMTAIGQTEYSAAKAALISACQNLAVKYSPREQGISDADHGWIRINVAVPGTIRTRVWTHSQQQRDNMDRMRALYPMGRVGEPDDVAAAVAFLASSDASWITGAALPVDGGFMLGPSINLI
ncbi:MAG TPA: SDR family oxidoreductase [Candidatus Stackebrandtia faecavium]|nr:SDR family oxidoreductase [Candidatus Stackebrandtia faecavium]